VCEDMMFCGEADWYEFDCERYPLLLLLLLLLLEFCGESIVKLFLWLLLLEPP
jgi:hypothetical protein